MGKMRGITQKWAEAKERYFNDLSLRKKLRYLYYFCILVPIFLTDAVILVSLLRAERYEQQREMVDVSSAVQYAVTNFTESPIVLARTIYLDNSIRAFLQESFRDPVQYYNRHLRILDESVLKGISGIDNTVITIYAKNQGIVNGGGFMRTDSAEGEEWFERFKESPYDTMLIVYDTKSDGRKITLLRTLTRHTDETKMDMFVRIDMDYPSLVRNITSMNYPYEVYLCLGEKTMLSSRGPNNVQEMFPAFTRSADVGLEESFDLYGQHFNIRVLRPSNSILQILRDNAVIFALLLLFNILSPQFLMNVIERSITSRIFRLGEVFNQADSEELGQIEGETGRDEIGSLMDNYNRMARRMNDLIDQVYRNRLKEQEMDIAKQNAELLALQSQINPHFLFNALESIRMHSILKEERETADMVEKLALMERQNVDWSTGTNTIRKELEFTEAYLGLQKYRFGDRLSYRVEVQPGCEEILVPKLTVTTFVENACVHGIESKTSPGWIFVRVSREAGELCVEVEDTGGGMEEDEVAELSQRMEAADIQMLKGKGRVGIVNACLRLRMVTNGAARFSVESEVGIGTVFTIRIPLEKTERAE